MSQPHQEEPSASDIHNEQQLQQNDDEQSIFVRLNLTPKKIAKTALLLVLIVILVLLVATIGMKQLTNTKRLFKIVGDSQMQEFSGLDQQGYRSFYFYKQFQKLARENKKTKTKFDATRNLYNQITFNELYGLFKVIKAIQYAKNYSPFPQKVEQSQQFANVDLEILQKVTNYTQYFQPVANQYRCGSCYSFPITATIEYLYKKHLNVSVKLSEQQLIDCSAEDQSVDGCSSGNITKGFQYAIKVGLVSQEDYPYRSRGGNSFPCRTEVINNPDVKKYKITGFRQLPKDNCKAIQFELSQGNVVASMMAAGLLAQYTQSQKTAFRNCPKDPFNHAITVVGQTQKQQWIIRNSWGSSWGKNGYFILRGNNTCGVCSHSIVPELSPTHKSP